MLKRVLSLEFNRLLEYYRDMPNLDLDEGASKRKEKEGRVKKDKDRREAEDGYERLMVNIGKSAGFFPGNLMDLVNSNVVGSKPVIGRIDLLPTYTLFDVRKGDARRVIDALKGVDFFGERLYAEIATNKDYSMKSNRKRSKKAEKEKFIKESKKDKKKEKRYSSIDELIDYELSLIGKSGNMKKKKSKKEKKGKKESKDKMSPKPKYDGNYDIFMK